MDTETTEVTYLSIGRLDGFPYIGIVMTPYPDLWAAMVGCGERIDGPVGSRHILYRLPTPNLILSVEENVGTLLVFFDSDRAPNEDQAIHIATRTLNALFKAFGLDAEQVIFSSKTTGKFIQHAKGEQ